MKMRLKKVTSLFCAVSLLFAINTTPVLAEVNTDTATNSNATKKEESILHEDIDLLSPDEANELLDMEEALSIGEAGNIEIKTAPTSVPLETTTTQTLNTSSAKLIDELPANTRSEGSVTQQFTDYITTPDEQKYVQFDLAKGQIVNLSLQVPANNRLDYDLVLTSVAADGTATPIKDCILGTYVDPNTGKSVDEGISYIHTQNNIGSYAVFVVSSAGSSTTESFTLTISLDIAGSYDTHETNDSPFEATVLPLSGKIAETTASLHVPNDQDWYAVTTTKGVYKVKAGDYDAEVYYATTGNKMVRATRSKSGNYILGAGTYYFKVSSTAAVGDFSFGEYALTIENISIYDTINTAFNYGEWEKSYTRNPDLIPDGQQIAYYKFSIDSKDKAYANIGLSNYSTSPMLIEVLDSSGESINYGYTGDADILARGVITKSSGSKELVVDMNGLSIGSMGYIRVSKLDYADSGADMRPFLDRRMHPGSGTFRFTGTASNPGNSYSTTLTLDLSDKPNVPQGAIATDIYTSGTLSPDVMGVDHMLNPGGKGWVTAVSGMGDDGSFDMEPYGQEVKQSWQFMYYQSAFARTTISRLEMRVSWEYDINKTNYESFQY